MSMFTGLAPRVHGIGNQRSSGNQELSGGITTLAEALKGAGYRTGAVTSGGNVKGYLGFERGFEIYDDTPRNLVGKLASASDWIEAANPAVGSSERPWFFFFHTYAVHDPYLPPKKWRERFVDSSYAGRIIGDRNALRKAIRAHNYAPWTSSHQRSAENFWARVDPNDPADLEYLHQLYMAGVASLDSKLRQFLVGLERKGLLDNTVVVLTSDHGEEFGEHGQTRHNQLWQELLHIPLVVHLPGDSVEEATGPNAGRRISAPVRHMDLAPSLVELLGLDAKRLFQQEFTGSSWASWLVDTANEDFDRVIYSEHRSKLERPLDLWALRDYDALVISPEPGGDLLFVDRSSDPEELWPKRIKHLLGSSPANLDLSLPLIDLRAHELGRLQRAAIAFDPGQGIELDEATRFELEGLGYL